MGLMSPIVGLGAVGFGDHQVRCGGNGDRIHRHDSLKDALYSAAHTLGQLLGNLNGNHAEDPSINVCSLICDLVSKASDSRSKASALSTAIPHAGDWLNVVPSKALGLHLFHL